MRIAGIVIDSIVDGEGIRDVIFFQGCPHHCKGCHNPETWRYDGGYFTKVPTIVRELSRSRNNVTISGGEPLEQYNVLISLLSQLHAQGKTMWLYTGFKYENFNESMWKELHEAGVEVVVDGAFREDKKDSTLLFRGSSNQRLIDLGNTLSTGRIVSWEETK